VKKIDHMREKVSILPTSVYLSQMHDAGWSLVALEWEREVEISAQPLEREAPAASEGNPLRPSHCLRLPPLGRRPPGNANSQISGRNDCPGPLVHQHGGRPERPRVSHSRRPPMDRRGRLQAYSSPDRSHPAPPLRRRVGIAQETIVPRHLELLRGQNTPHVLRGEAVPEFAG
jgi:hypothetical protein